MAEELVIEKKKDLLEVRLDRLFHDLFNENEIDTIEWAVMQILKADYKDIHGKVTVQNVRNCWDNAPQESFFGPMKDEIYLGKCKIFLEVKAIIDDWMYYYNNERYQWDLAKLAPVEYYKYLTTGEYPIKIGQSKKL